MALSQRLELRQGQTPGHDAAAAAGDQAAAAVQSRARRICRAELESNPLLERDDAERRSEREASAAKTAIRRKRRSLRRRRSPRDDFGTGGRSRRRPRRSLYGRKPRREAGRRPSAKRAPLTDWTRTGAGGRSDGDEDLRRRRSPSQATLKDHLEAQLAIAALAPRAALHRRGADRTVDEAGYLRADLGEVAERLGTALADCEAVA